MLDVLVEIRRAIVAGEEVDIDKTSVTIGSKTRLDRSAPTTFHSMRGRGDPYLLESVFYQFRFRDLPYNDYVQSCRREGVAHVTPLDKKDLLAYLTGEIDTCTSIIAKTADEISAQGDAEAGSRPLAEQTEKEQAVVGEKRSLDQGDVDASVYAAQRKRDRDQRALDSVLMVAEWDFSSLREKLSQHIAKVKVGKGGAHGAAGGGNSTYDPRGDRYTNNEGRFWRENLGSEFHELGIDMSGSFKAKPSGGEANGSQRRDRKENRPSLSSGAGAKRKPIDPNQLIPIIIVPSATTLICSWNAVEFLQNGRYVSREELTKNPTAYAGMSRTSAFRTPGGNCTRAEYIVNSNPKRLTLSEWERVVAVVCSGQAWQFSKWPINDHGSQDLFRKVQGFYFHFDDVPPTGEVNSWAVKKLSLSRDKRHTDGQVQSQFWNTLDAFLRRKGRHLRY